MNKVWGIVGLGWLGSELAVELRKRGIGSWGTHSNEFNFESDPFPNQTCDVLFLNTPPLTQISPEKFVNTVRAESDTRVFFISSTSVYGSSTGVLTESSPVSPATDSARWLVETEKGLRAKFKNALTVIRPGGLIGGERHPVFSLSRKKTIPNGGQAINLIHRSDLIGIVLAAAEAQDVLLVNAVAPFHPTKLDYYTEWAEKLGLPRFLNTEEGGAHRVIDSEILPKLYPNWICPRLDFISS